MNPVRGVRLCGLLLVLTAAAADVNAQAVQAPGSVYTPSVGQKGKDVIWVPTPQALVDKMLDMAKVTPSDYLMDLGSGDGRLVITAAKRGARAIGVEYEPDMVELSKRSAEQEGVSSRAQFMKADLFQTDLSPATVITMFLLTDINIKLRPTLLELKPGTRIVSNSFTMGDWEADETATISHENGCDGSWCTALLWIVPAKVAGTHKTPRGELKLEQTYQMLSGSFRSGDKLVPVKGRVVGEEVILNAGGEDLRARVSGKELTLR